MAVTLDIEKAVDVARRAVDAAVVASMKHYQTGVRIERKADRSPVTRADKESEEGILRVIREAFPTHAILAEETGAHAGEADSRWIVDPLDGTRGFTRGGTFWGPLVALEHRGEIVAGAMALPAMNVRYWAGRGLGTFRDGTRLRVSGVTQVQDATLSLGQMNYFFLPTPRSGMLELVRDVDSSRAFGDLASLAMLLEGRADIWMEGGVQSWDLAPLKILVEEAGGKFTDLEGKPTVHSGHALATNGLLHDELLRRLSTG
jgi:histidinol-phosphatase